MPISQFINFESDWLGITAPKPALRARCANWYPDNSANPPIQYCPKCGQTLAPGEFRAATSSCSACFNRRFPFQRIIRLGAYTGHLRNWTHQLKFERDLALGKMLAEHLANSILTADLMPEIDLVVPMPTTLRRRLRRGIDHSTLIARIVANKINRPLIHALRKSPRPPQRTKTGIQRHANVRNSIHPARFMSVKDAHILLVDDIVTTHASIIEAAKVLRQKAAAALVTVAVLAVTEDRNHPNLPTTDPLPHGAD